MLKESEHLNLGPVIPWREATPALHRALPKGLPSLRLEPCSANTLSGKCPCLGPGRALGRCPGGSSGRKGHAALHEETNSQAASQQHATILRGIQLYLRLRIGSCSCGRSYFRVCVALTCWEMGRVPWNVIARKRAQAHARKQAGPGPGQAPRWRLRARAAMSGSVQRQ